MQDTARTRLDADIARIEEALGTALDERVPAEKNYHVRVALQDLVVLADRLDRPIRVGDRGHFDPLRR